MDFFKLQEVSTFGRQQNFHLRFMNWYQFTVQNGELNIKPSQLHV